MEYDDDDYLEKDAASNIKEEFNEEQVKLIESLFHPCYHEKEESSRGKAHMPKKMLSTAYRRILVLTLQTRRLGIWKNLGKCYRFCGHLKT